MTDQPAGNPFNDQPTVRLLTASGDDLGLVSQRAAGRLLRRGHADLVLQVPPAVRLTIDTTDYQALQAAGPQDEAARAQFLHARQGLLYGNVHFQSPVGETMFHGDAEKALWYLNRRLVEVVSASPPVLRFRFAPGGPGHVGDDYYLTGKANRCVVCGAEEGLNRHHVVPRVYRRHLPPEVKDHSHHDVLLMCLACHEKYESAANELKAELGGRFGVPLHGLRGERDHERNQAVKLAIALRRHGAQIPEARRLEMLRILGGWLGKWPVDEADVEQVAGLTSEEARVEHGRHVVGQVDDVEAFIRSWRAHFVEIMQPRFLPAHWSVDRE
jgi:hypothetical protein